MSRLPQLSLSQLAQLREALVPHWQTRSVQFRTDHTCTPHPEKSPDHGMCRFTAAFLQAFLRGQGLSLRVAGGSVWPPQFTSGGFMDAQGEWHSHYWLTDGHWIYDITSSQFGAEPVIITPSTDPRYQENFSAQEIREHLIHVRNTVKQWQSSIGALPAQESANHG